MHIFYFDPTGALQEVWFSGGAWHKQSLGPAIGASAGQADTAITSILFPGDGAMHIFYFDPAGALQEVWGG